MNKPIDLSERIEQILTKHFATKPDGRAWCTRHAHKLDIGICLSCKAQTEIEALCKDYARELMGEMEHRETEDMSLKSWTPEDYKAFGRNELRTQIIQKLDQANNTIRGEHDEH